MEVFEITYTHILTGERKSYMNVGFPNRKVAKDEIERLKREAQRYKKMNYDLNSLYEKGVHLIAPLVGKNWRIRKVKIRPL